jgi:4-alpha-glucanotransferase
MNLPGRAYGNWGWRYDPTCLTDAVRDHLRDITILFARYIPPRDRPLKGQGNI